MGWLSGPPHVDTSTKTSETTRLRVDSEDSVEVWSQGVQGEGCGPRDVQATRRTVCLTPATSSWAPHGDGSTSGSPCQDARTGAEHLMLDTH